MVPKITDALPRRSLRLSDDDVFSDFRDAFARAAALRFSRSDVARG